MVDKFYIVTKKGYLDEDSMCYSLKDAVEYGKKCGDSRWLVYEVVDKPVWWPEKDEEAKNRCKCCNTCNDNNEED